MILYLRGFLTQCQATFMQCSAALCKTVKAESSQPETISHAILFQTECFALQFLQLKLVHVWHHGVLCMACSELVPRMFIEYCLHRLDLQALCQVPTGKCNC